MSKKSDQLEQEQLANRWNVTNNPAIGVTCVASSPAPNAVNGRMLMDVLLWTVNNGKGAAAATFTGSIRDASIGGTVLNQFDVVVAAGGSNQDAFYPWTPGINGNALVFEFGTPQASTIQKATIAGWQESAR